MDWLERQRQERLAEAEALEAACLASAPDQSPVLERLVGRPTIEVRPGWYRLVAEAHEEFLAVRPAMRYHSIGGSGMLQISAHPLLPAERYVGQGEPFEDPRIHDIERKYRLRSCDVCEFCGQPGRAYRAGVRVCPSHGRLVDDRVEIWKRPIPNPGGRART